MILAPKQADRFIELFNLLMEYVAKRLMDERALDPMSVFDEASFGKAVQEAVWGERGNTVLIEDFVRESPKMLSSADVDEVLSWKDGLFYMFPVLREGDDTIVIYGERAFAVRGINREIHSLMTLPCFAEGVILPFDGLITYGTILLKQNVQIQGNMAASLQDEVREYVEAGKLARTAEEFKRFVVEARSASARRHAESEEWEAAMEGAAGELIEGQCRSPLADVGWDERMEAFEASQREQERLDISATLNGWSTGGPDGTSLAKCLGCMTKDGLVELAKGLELGGSLRRMRKAELVEAIASGFDFDALDFVVDSAQYGVRELRCLIDVVRAGGRIDFTVADIATIADVPLSTLPILWLFTSGDGYSLIMPDECRDRFAALPDDLFETYLEKAETLDALVRRIEVMVQLRGIVTSAEVTAQLRGTIGNDEPNFYLDGLAKRSGSGYVSFRWVEVPGDPDGAYLHANLVDIASEVDETVTIADPELVAEIIKHSSLFPARNGDEFEDLEALDRWMREHRTYRALVSYLDGCVPVDEDDRSWAVAYADGVVDAARRAYSVQDTMGLLMAEDLDLSEAQHVHATDLIGDLLNDVPKWTNNGWAPNELRDRRSQGRAARPEIKVTPRRPKRKRPHKKRKR